MVTTVGGRPAAIYVASRASVPERAAMWRRYRDQGFPIASTWIDEAGEGETGDLGELWTRILGEIRASAALVFYAEESDFPLKGAYVEVGAALALDIPVLLVLPRVSIDVRSGRPVGSWIHHPRCSLHLTLSDAMLAATHLATVS